jgi:hypothetical protein
VGAPSVNSLHTGVPTRGGGREEEPGSGEVVRVLAVDWEFPNRGEFLTGVGSGAEYIFPRGLLARAKIPW